MNNYAKLYNPPKRLLKLLNKLYLRKYKKHKFDIVMSKFHFSVDLSEDECKQLQKCVPEEVDTISWNLITKAGPPAPTHIDRGRKTALQIPVLADPSCHYAYVLKNENMFNKLVPQENPTGFIQKLDVPWTNQRYPGMPMYHQYEEEYFDVFPVEPWIPYLNDTSLPHGGLHTKEKYRFFYSFSITERKTVEELKKSFESWI